MRASGWNTPTNQPILIGHASGVRTAATSPITSKSGASATRSTDPGSWATRTPRITPSSRWKPPKPCGAPTAPIKLIASGSSNFRAGSDWVTWNRTVLENLKSEIDYISLHTYIGNPDNNFEKFLAASRDIDDRIEVVGGLIQAINVTTPRQRPIYIAFDEWNVWYRARGGSEFDTAKTRLEEVYNYEDALVMGMFLNSFFRHANIVKMANLAQLVNVIAPMMTNKDGLFLQTIYFPLAEYARQKGNQSLDVLVNSPEYKPDGGRSLKYLDVSSTYDAKSRQVYLNVLNRSEKSDIAARIISSSGNLCECRRHLGTEPLRSEDDAHVRRR